MNDSATSISPALRLLEPPAEQVAAAANHTPVPLQPDWQRLISDLTTFGLVRLKVGNGTASIESLGDPWYASRDRHACALHGPGIFVAGLTDRWAAAALRVGDHGGRFEELRVTDHADRILFAVMLTEDTNWSSFHALLVRQWARRGSPAALPGQPPVSGDDLARLQACCADWPACDLRPCWHERPPTPPGGIAFDPTLIPVFLETMVDEACPLCTLLGNAGVLQRHDNSYFDLRQEGEALRLRSCTANLSLQPDGITAARADCTRQCSDAWRIHLYDQQWHCVVTLGLAAGADNGDRHLWRSMVQALID